MKAYIKEKKAEQRTIGEILSLAMVSEFDDQTILCGELETKFRDVILNMVKNSLTKYDKLNKNVE